MLGTISLWLDITVHIKCLLKAQRSMLGDLLKFPAFAFSQDSKRMCHSYMILFFYTTLEIPSITV